MKLFVKSSGKPVIASDADEALDEFQYLEQRVF